MKRRSKPEGQRGFFLLAVFILMILAGGIYFLTRLSSTSTRTNAQEGENRENHAKIRDALVNFVSTNGYLPCPADGTLATGLAAPTGAIATCTAPFGVVPWATLGLSAADVTDPYQNKISYRVYAGATGLTQASGASMVNCDSTRAALPVPQTVGVDGTGLCRTDHDTSPAQFLLGKGLSVTDAGAAVGSVAFVLISHGKNGAGAYRADGVRNSLPNVASAEYGHTLAAGPFVIKAANTVELAQTDTNYFDDSVSYATISDLAGRAKVAARDWPDPTPPLPPTTTFTAATTAAAAAAAGATPVGSSTNASTLNIDGVTVFSTTTGGFSREISSLTGTSGYGIGVLTTSATTGGVVSNTDLLRLTFGTTGQKFGIMLVDFGSVFGQAERVQVQFKNGTTTVQTTTLTSCRVGSQLASYSTTVTAPFNRVELVALSRVGSGTSSDFLVGAVTQCPASAVSCYTANATVTTNCP